MSLKITDEIFLFFRLLYEKRIFRSHRIMCSVICFIMCLFSVRLLLLVDSCLAIVQSNCVLQHQICSIHTFSHFCDESRSETGKFQTFFHRFFSFLSVGNGCYGNVNGMNMRQTGKYHDGSTDKVAINQMKNKPCEYPKLIEQHGN